MDADATPMTFAPMCLSIVALFGSLFESFFFETKFIRLPTQTIHSTFSSLAMTRLPCRLFAGDEAPECKRKRVTSGESEGTTART
jgi:hypothetical protein